MYRYENPKLLRVNELFHEGNVVRFKWKQSAVHLLTFAYEAAVSLNVAAISA